MFVMCYTNHILPRRSYPGSHRNHHILRQQTHSVHCRTWTRHQHISPLLEVQKNCYAEIS